MKKITLLILMLGFTSFINGQCLTAINGLYPAATYVPSGCDGITVKNITTLGYASEYSNVTVTSGVTYTFASSIVTDIVTISTDAGVTAETFGIGSVTWVATLSGDVRFYTNLNDGACGAQSSFRVRTLVCGTPPTCPAPTGLTSASITTTSATISWTAPATVPAAGYDYYYDVVTTAPDITTVASGSSVPPTASLSGLTGATKYYFWVRSNCGTEVGPWSLSGTFTTLCDVITDFSENFDAAVAFPACWGRVGTGGNTYVQASTTAPSLPNNLYLYGTSATNQGIVAMPAVSNAGDNTHRLKFKIRANITVGGIVQVGYLTNPSDAASFVSVQQFVTTSTTVYDSYTAILGTAPGTNQVLAFRHLGTPGNSVLIDDVVWEALPSCSEPTSLLAAITYNSATFTWTASATNAISYEYVLDSTDADPTTAGTTTTALTYTASGLIPLTQYYFHIRTNCSTTSNSVWVTKSFITPAIPPSNDNCADAIPLTLGNVFADNAIVGTTIGGNTTLTGLPVPTCVPTARINEVWYTVIPTATIMTVETAAVTGSLFTDSVISVFSGTCGALTQIGCNDDIVSGTNNFSRVALTGLTVGTPIYIGVWKYLNTLAPIADGEFQISVYYDASLASSSFNASGFASYPNPVIDILNLSYSKNIDKVQVMNLLGQEVIAKSINTTDAKVDMSALTSGTYLVKVTSDNQIRTIKVIKQ